jgi:hypothetical protein
MALGLALLPGTIIAQQGTLKQQLLGTWTPVTVTTRDRSTRWRKSKRHPS